MKSSNDKKKFTQSLLKKFLEVREHSEAICAPLEIEDYVVQPIAEVSPPKWHLGHSSWFFETFLLIPYSLTYEVYDSNFSFVFNSYYETVGARVMRTDRGNLSRPSVKEVYQYRLHVNSHVKLLLQEQEISDEIAEVIELGLQHEQQHQELLYTDIKYILGHNPLFPEYHTKPTLNEATITEPKKLLFPEDIYEIGYQGTGFCFDNELGRHKVYLDSFKIESHLVNNACYMEFLNDGGYTDFKYWHADGWDWVKKNQIKSPLYWHKIDGIWMHFTLHGLQKIEPEQAVCHISYFEASAYAAWKGMRLPTEFEWEIASEKLHWGLRWEWTDSAYLPYPGFKKAPGAIGEYNGKFMINQMVLRGASVATSEGHSRKTYRNFFQPQHQSQFTGIRLVK